MISEHHIPSIKHHIPDILEILQQFLGLIFNCMDWFEIIVSPPILGILISNKLSMTFYIPIYNSSFHCDATFLMSRRQKAGADAGNVVPSWLINWGHPGVSISTKPLLFIEVPLKTSFGQLRLLAYVILPSFIFYLFYKMFNNRIWYLTIIRHHCSTRKHCLAYLKCELSI